MVMRGTERLAKRTGKEFVRNLIRMLVASTPLAAILILGAGLSPLGVLAFVGIFFVPVTAAMATVAVLRSGADGEARIGRHGRTWGERGHYSGGSSHHPGFSDGGGFGGSGCDGGGGGGVGGDCGGGG